MGKVKKQKEGKDVAKQGNNTLKLIFPKFESEFNYLYVFFYRNSLQ